MQHYRQFDISVSNAAFSLVVHCLVCSTNDSILIICTEYMTKICRLFTGEIMKIPEETQQFYRWNQSNMTTINTRK